MRALVFFLILANLLFWAWGQGYLGTSSNPDALRVQQQLLADRVKIVSRDEPPFDAAHSTLEAKAEKPAPFPVSEPEKVPEVVAEKLPEPKPAEACVQLGDIPVDDVERLEKTLAANLPDFKAKRIAVKDASVSYWVYIPALATKRDVDAKVAELKKLQIQEYFVIQENGPNNHAISLGLFSRREAADNFLESLKLKKVRSARMAEKIARPASATLEIQGPEMQREALRQAISQVLPDSSLTACVASAASTPKP